MEHTPLVSVIMPAYCEKRFLKQAVDSVKAQTMESWELLILDDCSPDDTFALAQSFAAQDSRIQALRNDENMGVAATRNRGIALAKGKYIAFLDGDDIWSERKLELQIKALEKQNADIVYCAYTIIEADGTLRSTYRVPKTVDYEMLLKENSMQCSAMLLRAQVAKAHPFRTDFFHEDYVLGLELLKDGCKAVGCREVLLSWRLDKNSRSFNKRKAAQNRWRIYRDYLHLPLPKRLWVFGCYTLKGARKYLRKKVE